MITHLRHTGIVVTDMERALGFWRDLLGFRIVRRQDESGPHMDAMMGLTGVRVTTVKLAAPDGGLIELLQFHSHPDGESWTGSPYSTGLTHLALQVDDLGRACRLLEDAGVTFPAEPQQSPDGTVRVTYGRGPEGVLLELVQILRQP